jgi:hypothetical protein
MTDDLRSIQTKFPIIDGQIVKLRELLIGDANDLSSFMTYNVSKSLWEVPYPYTLDNALNFIDSSHKEFRSLKTVNFAILYKKES